MIKRGGMLRCMEPFIPNKFSMAGETALYDLPILFRRLLLIKTAFSSSLHLGGSHNTSTSS
ncbi:MAG: hypothetical protein ACXVZU_05000 [Methanobacteriaceae archaeon]